MELIIQKIEELGQAVQALLKFANGRKKMVFYGEIGAGKTTFIQALCRHFSITDPVTSPTFSLVNEYSYETSEQKEGLVYHLDLYRLKNLQEALDIGIEDYLYDQHYCLIEWPEIIESLLPPEVVRIKIELTSDSKRKILFL